MLKCKVWQNALQRTTQNLRSQINLNQKYSEEDLYDDIWAYADATPQLHPQDVLLLQPVEKPGFYYVIKLNLNCRVLIFCRRKMSKFKLANKTLCANI